MTVRACAVLLSVLLLTSLGFAQVTLNMNDFSIFPYTEATRAIVPNSNTMTAAGPNQTWDFTASATLAEWVECWDEPAGHWGAADFPNANLVMYSSIVPDYIKLTYYRRTASSYYVVGGAFYVLGNVITNPVDCDGDIISCPINYGDEWDWETTSEYEGVTTVDSRHCTIDAWGTLVDITGTYSVLRMRVDRTTTETPGDTEEQILYTWLAPDYGEIITIKSETNDNDPLFSDGQFERISDLMVRVDETAAATFRTFELLPAYPNPFNAATTLSFTLSSPGNVSIALLNTLGQQVETVTNAAFAQGTHQVRLNGAGLASGTYFVRLTTNGNTAPLQKITLLK